MIFIIPSLVLFFAAVTAAALPPAHSDMAKHRRASPQASVWLAAHNAVRAQHGAEPLEWSPFFAAQAQAWANKCEFQNTNGVLSSVSYGENIVAGTGNFPISAAVERFTQDASSYNPRSPTYSHFTQVVWKSTTRLGCASAQCDGIFDPRRGKATLYVCLYNPIGNVIGEAAANVQP